jgi:hypothetical protein
MGVSMFVVVDNPPADFDAFINGRGLAAHLDGLETEAERLDLVPLTSFLSMSMGDVEAVLDDFEVPDEANSLGDEWFPPDAGLRTVRGLKGAIESGQIPAGDDLRDDLARLEEVLIRAKDAGLRFHLSMEC